MKFFGKPEGGWTTYPIIEIALFELVFFPTYVADLAGPPALHPVSEVGNTVLGAASNAFRLGCEFDVFYFRFGH